MLRLHVNDQLLKPDDALRKLDDGAGRPFQDDEFGQRRRQTPQTPDNLIFKPSSMSGSVQSKRPAANLRLVGDLFEHFNYSGLGGFPPAAPVPRLDHVDREFEGFQGRRKLALESGRNKRQDEVDETFRSLPNDPRELGGGP